MGQHMMRRYVDDGNMLVEIDCGATAHDVALMARAVEHKLEVKASGGVRSLADAKAMVSAGATRIGASVGIKIAREARGEKVAAGPSTGY